MAEVIIRILSKLYITTPTRHFSLSRPHHIMKQAVNPNSNISTQDFLNRFSSSGILIPMKMHRWKNYRDSYESTWLQMMMYNMKHVATTR